MVKGDFDCYKNELISLEGAPREVGGDFDCRENKLETLDGKPQKIGGKFEIEEDVHKRLKKKAIGDFFRNIFGENDER